MQRGYDYIVVFGAAVGAEGKPSAVLQHRLDAALHWAAQRSQVRFLVTGGLGERPPAEAIAMRNYLMSCGIDDRLIVIEPEGRDTFSSSIRCIGLLRRQSDVRSVALCSSSYHLPRCWLIFRILGLTATPAEIESDRNVMGSYRWLRASLREGPAMAWDATLALGWRLLRFQSPAVLGSMVVLISVILSAANPPISA